MEEKYIKLIPQLILIFFFSLWSYPMAYKATKKKKKKKENINMLMSTPYGAY